MNTSSSKVHLGSPYSYENEERIKMTEPRDVGTAYFSRSSTRAGTILPLILLVQLDKRGIDLSPVCFMSGLQALACEKKCTLLVPEVRRE